MLSTTVYNLWHTRNEIKHGAWHPKNRGADLESDFSEKLGLEFWVRADSICGWRMMF